MKPKTKIWIRIFFLATAIFYSVFLFAPQAAQANVNSILHGQICEPDNGGQSSAFNIARCINNIYIFAIAIAGFVGVLMFVLAGYYYIQGSAESVSEAKSIMSSTLVALVILFGTYLLLNTIDPNLTRIPPIVAPNVNCTGDLCADLSVEGILPGSLGINGKVDGGINIPPPANNNNLPATFLNGKKIEQTPQIQQCTNCVNALNLNGIHVKPVPKDRANQQYVNADLAKKLLAMKDRFNFLISQELSSFGLTPVGTSLVKVPPDSWQITEAWPPTVPHISSCHYVGTCIDIAEMQTVSGQALNENQILAAVKLLCRAAKYTGINVVNEYYHYQGQFKGSDCPEPVKYSTSTGGNLHIY